MQVVGNGMVADPRLADGRIPVVDDLAYGGQPHTGYNVGVIDYSSPDEQHGDEDDLAHVVKKGKKGAAVEDDYSGDSSLEEGELNSAQKQRLKNDLLRMGYDEDEEEFGAAGVQDDDEEDEEFAEAAATHQNLMMMSKQ